MKGILTNTTSWVLVCCLCGCSLIHFGHQRTRTEKVDAYLQEFCSPAFAEGSNIHTAIRNVLLKIPDDVYEKVTDRRRPVLFTEVHPSGTARFANTAEIIVPPGDIPAFQDGLTIMKLSTELESAGSPDPIAGIVAHELAHKYLDHAIKGGVTCKTERETNTLVKNWGFMREFEAASENYGREKTGGPPACTE